MTPHIAINGAVSKHGVVRKTAVDGRTTRHAGYGVSQIVRKRIEEAFGWIKAQAGLVQVKVRGCAKVETVFTFAVAAYNLIRIPKLLTQAAAWEDHDSTSPFQKPPPQHRTWKSP